MCLIEVGENFLQIVFFHIETIVLDKSVLVIAFEWYVILMNILSSRVLEIE